MFSSRRGEREREREREGFIRLAGGKEI